MTRFSVPEMSCGHCKASIEKAVASVDADARVEVDLATREVTVNSQADAAVLIAAMMSEGYQAQQLN